MIKKIILILLNILQSTDLDNKWFAKIVNEKVYPQLKKGHADLTKYIPQYILKALGLTDNNIEIKAAKTFCKKLISLYDKTF